MQSSQPDHPGSRRAVALLLLGAAVGTVMAALGLAIPARDPNRLPQGVVARINGEAIRRDDYERMLGALASDRRTELTASDRLHVLDRLIEEELLVQRGLELGLARHDRRVRSDLTATVIASIVAESSDLQPSDEELRAFYEAHRDFFTRPGRLRVRQVFNRVRGAADAPAALARARQATRRLRSGESFRDVRKTLGDDALPPLPDAPLPPAKLRDYLGPTALRVALDLEVGDASDPVRSGTGYHVLQVVERQGDVTPPLSEIRTQVVAELRRRAGEQKLRSYLDDLRNRADVVVSEELP